MINIDKLLEEKVVISKDDVEYLADNYETGEGIYSDIKKNYKPNTLYSLTYFYASGISSQCDFLEEIDEEELLFSIRLLVNYYQNYKNYKGNNVGIKEDGYYNFPDICTKIASFYPPFKEHCREGKQPKVKLSKENCKKLLLEALEENPGNNYAYFLLARFTLLEDKGFKRTEKAKEYLLRIRHYESEDEKTYSYDAYDFDVTAVDFVETALGCLRNYDFIDCFKLLKAGYDFEKDYEDEDKFIPVIYYLAAAYMDGIGTKVNMNKAKKLIEELLIIYNKNKYPKEIDEIVSKDPLGIINKYFSLKDSAKS